MTDTPPKILTEHEVSKLTGLSLRTLRDRRCRRQEPIAIHLGKRASYLESDVLDWIARQRAEGVRRMHGEALDDRIEEWLQRQLDAAPPLTATQRELLRRILASDPAEQEPGDGAA